MKRFLNTLQISEINDLKKLCKNILLFAFPFLIVFLFNSIIDPFNLNQFIKVPLAKKEVACRYNERLWKLNNFLHNPTDYIIFGDSRATRLSEEVLTAITGKPFTNLALSGATLVEIIDTFWFVTKHHMPREVFICLNFDRFNDWQKAHYVHEAIACINKPLIHYMQPQTCKAVGALLLHYFFPNKVPSQQPPMTRDNFWHYQLDEIDQGYQRYVFPAYGSRQLTLIADYCKENKIHLTFLIFPTHVDLQQRIDRAHLKSQELHFKKFLASLATVYDFDIINEFTHNKNNFDDPKHVSLTAMNHIVSSVWGNQKTDSNISYA